MVWTKAANPTTGNLVTNGGFVGSAAGWTTDETIFSYNSNNMLVTRSFGGYGGVLFQDVSIVDGGVYIVSFKYTDMGSSAGGKLMVFLGDFLGEGAANTYFIATPSAAGTYQATLTASLSNPTVNQINFNASGSLVTGVLTDVSISGGGSWTKAVNPASGSTTTTTRGTPIGLLLALTYSTTSSITSVQWTKTTNPLTASWTKVTNPS